MSDIEKYLILKNLIAKESDIERYLILKDIWY